MSEKVDWEKNYKMLEQQYEALVIENSQLSSCNDALSVSNGNLIEQLRLRTIECVVGSR